MIFNRTMFNPMISNRRLLPTLALALLLPLAACKPEQPDSTPATGAAGASMAAAKQASAEDPAQVAAAEAAVRQMEAEAASAPPPVAGTDYELIAGGQPFEPVAGKIEVAEVFGYVCPACAGFQPLVAAWKPKLAADVNFVYVPALFGNVWDTYARAFYAAQVMGVQEKTHDAVYRAIHIDETLKGERGQDTPQDIANFYNAYGVDAAQFVETMGSFAVEGKLNKAKQFAQTTGITGTPTLIVAGKYRITGKNREDQIRIANQLIAQERGASGG